MKDSEWILVDTQKMFYCSSWEHVESSVRAKLFGTMVELSKDRVKRFISDLYHDAMWIREAVNGPIQFEWIVRESGTYIGESAATVSATDWQNARKYRFEIVDNDGVWILNIYEEVEDSKPVVPVDRVENPTLGNELSIKKGNMNMDEIIRVLNNKRNEADSARDEVSATLSDLEQAIEDLDNYIEEIDDLVSSLESLPSVDVNVSVDVSFDSY